ncbi:MAG: Fe-S protein assembly co-chaperone HscB [SAR324 cluster bacterium]|nr:Fe-S protein assembly co-chaperone HscB [SAR324 cluster bacterium]MBL7034136.1 Fe-S protein assembly co-chaperone HscB [SAR324 cluster bacterium]
MAFEQPACQTCESTLISRLFCFSCNAFQPLPREIDLFEVMGLPIAFEIDSEELEELYQRLSLELHPDFFETAPEAEKRLSETALVILNRAYNTLRDSTLRAGYLLFLLAKDKKLDERTLPVGFLQQMFNMQEALDELLNSDDTAALIRMSKDLQDRHKKIETSFVSLFKIIEDSPEDLEKLQQLQTYLNADRYLRRLVDRIPENGLLQN